MVDGIPDGSSDAGDPKQPAETPSSDIQIGSVGIGDGAAVSNSPVGASNVDYKIDTTNNSIGGDGFSVGRDFKVGGDFIFTGIAPEDAEEPTLPFELFDLREFEDGPDAEALVARLRSNQLLFVLFESSDHERFERVRNAALRKLDYAMRTTSETAPLEFLRVTRRRDWCRYEKPTALSLSRGTIAKNLEYLKGKDEEKRGPLRRKLAEGNCFVIVPVPRNEAASDYDALCRNDADHLWVLPRLVGPKAQPAPEQSPPPDVEVGQDALLKTVRFAAAFFQGLSAREMHRLVEALLKGVETEIDRPQPPRTPKFRAEPASPPPDLSTRWRHDQDGLLKQAGVVHRRGPSGTGGYAFASAGHADHLRSLFLSESRQWCMRRLEAVLDVLFGDQAPSVALQQRSSELLLQFDEHQIVEVDAGLLWDLFERRVVTDKGWERFATFQRMFRALLLSSTCRAQATAFLNEIPARCRDDVGRWMSVLYDLPVIRTYLEARRAVPGEALKDVHRAIEALDYAESEPFRRTMLMQGLVIGVMSSQPVDAVVPLLLRIATPSEREFRFPLMPGDASDYQLYVRPSVCGVFLGLRNYFGNLEVELLPEFGAALLALQGKVAPENNPQRVEALSVLLDAFHQSVYDAVLRCAQEDNGRARDFIEYAVDSSGPNRLGAVMARTCALRSPPRDWTLRADDPPLKGQDLPATLSVYAHLAAALHHFDGEGSPLRLQERLRSLMHPLHAEMDSRQREQWKTLLRNADPHFRALKTRYEKAGDREQAGVMHFWMTSYRQMLAAMP